MKPLKRLLIIAALLTLCYPARAISIVNGPIYNPANGHAYYLLSPATWTASELFSESLGGHLVTINDAAEDSWVWNNVNVGSGPLRNAHIGLNDMNEDGIWTWISGEPVTYLNWSSGEPNGIGAPSDWTNYTGTPDPMGWNDIPNTDVLYGIAEVPEPSAASLVVAGMICGAVARRVRKSPITGLS